MTLELPTDENPVVVIEGDCLDVLPWLPKGCVGATITDPPYQSLDVEVETGTTTRLLRRDQFGGKPLAASDGPAWFNTLDDAKILDVLSQCERPTHRDGAMYCFADVKSGLRLFPGWAKNVIVWDKTKIGMGYAWRRMHEWIGYRPLKKHKLRDMTLGDIIRVPGVFEKQHPSEKPVAVIRPLIRNSTDIGDILLDPFAGSGVTGVAAILEGRKAILIEKDPAYAAIARRRIAQALGDGPGTLIGSAKAATLFDGEASNESQ